MFSTAKYRLLERIVMKESSTVKGHSKIIIFTHKQKMSRKYLVLVLLFLMLACGCASSPSQPPTPAVIATIIPKQKDLIFIEFFAGT
jgi:hypothetical protein